MARLNDTEGLRGSGCEGEEKTISSRKIDNGYLTRTSYYNPHTGACRSSEEYSKGPPPEMVERGSGVGDESLADTKRYLGKDV